MCNKHLLCGKLAHSLIDVTVWWGRRVETELAAVQMAVSTPENGKEVT